MPPLPQGRDNDLKLYSADGRIVTGGEALGGMRHADLILWLAGNQFSVMDQVIGTFRAQHPKMNVGLITLPPGLLLKAIEGGGWKYEDQSYPGRPDVYASVNLKNLRDLKSAGLMDTYMVCMHNELQIMVAKNNPKRISGIDDLVRADVRTSMPNPINEGIMQFYARKVLERHGLWDRISGGKECIHCQSTANNWFTAVHHRETPDRIREGRSDAGIVWKTEVLKAEQQDAPVEGVSLPQEDSLRNEVSYAIGILSGNSHRQAAELFLSFLGSSEGQDTYAKAGFVRATAEELTPKNIP